MTTVGEAMRAYISRYDGRKVSVARATDALEYSLDWVRRLGAASDEDSAGVVGVIELLSIVTLGLATQKPDAAEESRREAAA